MKLSLIAAIGKNRGIGINNSLPWSLPDDLKRFKKLTLGHPVIMGRKTYESIGKLLPGRKNIIITRDTSYAVAGAEIVHSLEEALRATGSEDESFVIGGGEIFKLALSRATHLYLTLVDTEPRSDAFFPEINEAQWKETESKMHAADGTHAHSFTFKTYERIRMQ